MQGDEKKVSAFSQSGLFPAEKRRKFGDSKESEKKADDDRPEEAGRYYDLGTQHLQSGNAKKALPNFNKALEIVKAHGEAHKEMALIYGMLGEVHNVLGNQQERLKCFQQALENQLKIYEEDDPQIA